AFYPALDPPAVEDAETGDAVEGRLHAARAGRFLGLLGVVEPEVGAAAEELRQPNVVVLEVDDLEVGAKVVPRCEYLSDQRLTGSVLGVGFAGEHDLDRARFADDRPQRVSVGEDEGGAFIGR